MEHTDFRTYQGKTGNYNLISVKENKMDRSTSPEISKEFRFYLRNELKYSDAEKICLSLEKVKSMSSHGLQTLVNIKYLGEDEGYPQLKLLGCKGEIKRFINNSMLTDLFDYVDNIESL